MRQKTGSVAYFSVGVIDLLTAQNLVRRSDRSPYRAILAHGYDDALRVQIHHSKNVS